MIQRVQTLFLLGVIISMALIVIFPIWEKADTKAGIKYVIDTFYIHEFQNSGDGSDLWELKESKPIFYLAGIGGVVCLVALYSIFQFKKRTMQIKLGALNAFLMMAFIAIATYFIYQGEDKVGLDIRGDFKPGYFLPLAAMILNSLANRFVKKDEKLIRSVDRIR